MFYFPKFSSCFTLFLHKIVSFKSDNILLFWLIQTTFSKLQPQGAENSKFMPWRVHIIFKNVFGPPVRNIIVRESPVTPSSVFLLPLKVRILTFGGGWWGKSYLWRSWKVKFNLWRNWRVRVKFLSRRLADKFFGRSKVGEI